jgi:hypothetical protein
MNVKYFKNLAVLNVDKKIFKNFKNFFHCVNLSGTSKFFTKRFSVRYCMIIKKNPEVPERLTDPKIYF